MHCTWTSCGFWHVICNCQTMRSILSFVASLMVLGTTLLNAQDSPQISFASSFYKTASGAIGPQHIVASDNYRIKIEGIERMVVDSMLIRGQKIICGDLILHAENGLIDLDVRVAIHQKEKVWYTGKIMSNENITHSCHVGSRSQRNDLSTQPALIIFGHHEKTAYKLIKNKFDQQHSQFNK